MQLGVCDMYLCVFRYRYMSKTGCSNSDLPGSKYVFNTAKCIDKLFHQIPCHYGVNFSN